MKIEKINENKIRIIFNDSYLAENNIDIHSFMSNSIESQALFLNLLDKAEDEVGFITDNYKLSIEELALNNGNFIITVTRIAKETKKPIRVQTHKKEVFDTKNLIYKFATFDDFLNYKNFLSTIMPEKDLNFSKLYKYNDFYFLILKNISTAKIVNSISEFATSLEYSDLLVDKINEYGIVVT